MSEQQLSLRLDDDAGRLSIAIISRAPSFTDKLGGVKLRMATPDDAKRIVTVLREHMAGTAWAGYLQFDTPRAWQSLHRAINADTRPHLLAIDANNDIVGLVSYDIDHDWTTRPYANLHEIWARHDYRKTALGRLLLYHFLELARHDGAVAIHAAIAGTQYVRTLKNLMRKVGFEECGCAMRKVL